MPKSWHRIRATAPKSSFPIKVKCCVDSPEDTKGDDRHQLRCPKRHPSTRGMTKKRFLYVRQVLKRDENKGHCCCDDSPNSAIFDENLPRTRYQVCMCKDTEGYLGTRVQLCSMGRARRLLWRLPMGYSFTHHNQCVIGIVYLF